MLCNPEKMPITEWPHPQIEQIRGVPAMTASTKLMESRSSSTHEDQQQQQQQPPPPQQQQQPLKCPRCDSCNTKFCYYNNYSLSQPRHFCKACKRYWTRGGTLRNVPVGGGCRKNKRVKRPPSAAAPSAADASAYGLPPPADMGGPLAAGFPANLRSLNMENMNINVVPNSSSNSTSGFDLPHLWMNFPAAVPTTTTTTSDGGDQYQYNPNPNPNHSSLLPDFSLLGSSASSILASCTLQNNPKVPGINSTSTRPCNDFQVFFPIGGLHQNGGGHGNMNIKGVKMEEESMNAVLGNKMGTNWYENSMENNNMGSHHDSSVYWSSSSSGGMGAAAWPDHGTNYGSSITPLI